MPVPLVPANVALRPPVFTPNNKEGILKTLARSAADANPSLQAAATTFIADVGADTGGFTRQLAEALATNASFADVVASDPDMSKTVLSTLPGANITGVCAELAANKQGTSADDVFNCMCRRTATSPPLVSCIGGFASLMFKAVDRAATDPAFFQDAADAFGRKLKDVFPNGADSEPPLRRPSATKADSSTIDAPTHGGLRDLLQSTHNPAKSSSGSMSPLCAGKSIAETLKATKWTGCNVKVELPIASQLCSNLAAGKDTVKINDEKGGANFFNGLKGIGALAGSGLSAGDNIYKWLVEDGLGISLNACCYGTKVLDLCIDAGAQACTW